MADLSLVHQAPQPAAGAHVLIIGVGKYPHLIGGKAQLLPDHQGLGQLTSPARSAQALASWFTAEFNNPTRPLASLRLLVSDQADTTFTHGKTGAITDTAPATIENIEAAFRAWHTDCDSHVDNLAMLYFCGHGLASGQFTALLAEDFGKDPLNALAGSLDFFRNRNGMNSCKAKQQLYLIDACRTGARMMQLGSDYAGQVFLQPRALGGTTLRPVLYSTLYGEQAFGREAEPSHFCEALIAALRGAGGDISQGDWRINTSTLHRAIEAHMDRKIKAGLASDQIPLADNLATFDLHYLSGDPVVPVFVSCKPSTALPSARLRCLSAGAVVHERSPADSDWALSLRVGFYEFEAQFDAGPYQSARATDYIHPPERLFPLKVGL